MNHDAAATSHLQASEPGRRISRFAFLQEFLRSPLELGTCFTSSPSLSRAMVRGLDLAGARCVVELGPGTGPLTQRILEQIPSGCTFFAIERNAGLAELLHKRWPRLSVHVDDAANIREICASHGIEPGGVDAVVSSIPFLLLPPPVQAQILHEVAGVIRPGGGFTTVTYRAEGLLPGVKPFRRLLEAEFSNVSGPRAVIANVPPAFVYRCTK